MSMRWEGRWGEKNWGVRVVMFGFVDGGIETEI